MRGNGSLHFLSGLLVALGAVMQIQIHNEPWAFFAMIGIAIEIFTSCYENTIR